jgi:hypothetical protein
LKDRLDTYTRTISYLLSGYALNSARENGLLALKLVILNHLNLMKCPGDREGHYEHGDPSRTHNVNQYPLSAPYRTATTTVMMTVVARYNIVVG